MRRMFLLVSVAALFGCTDDPLPSPTVSQPPAMQPDAPGTLPDLRFNRPPPRDMDLTDAGDQGLDGSLDAGDAMLDMAPETIVDAQADMAPASCQGDPCVLAVELTRCEACPIAVPASTLADLPCTVAYDPASPLFEYIPFDCTADCPPDALQACNAPVGQPVCGDDGRCRVVE